MYLLWNLFEDEEEFFYDAVRECIDAGTEADENDAVSGGTNKFLQIRRKLLCWSRVVSSNINLRKKNKIKLGFFMLDSKAYYKTTDT